MDDGALLEIIEGSAEKVNKIKILLKKAIGYSNCIFLSLARK